MSDGITGASAASQPGGVSPPRPLLRIARQGHFHVNGRYESEASQAAMGGQMYVEFQIPARAARGNCPVVFIHGGGHTGAAWLSTPDGRPGWPDHFLARGWPVYVVDQPGRGRSPAHAAAYGTPAATPTVRKAQHNWAASEKAAHPAWPQARLHTRWPGGTVPGDPVFDQYYAHLATAIADQGLQEDLTTAALIALLERIGPAVLIEHSQPGPAVWRVADARPELVRGIVAVEPSGPPFFERESKAAAGRDRPYGPSRGPLTYDPPVRDASELEIRQQAQPDGPDLVACWLQAGTPRRLPRLAGIPILFLLSEASYHAPYDHCTSLYLKQAGVDNDFVRLADLGIHGNGHLMLVEDNSTELAAWVERWLARRLRRSQRSKDGSNEVGYNDDKNDKNDKARSAT
jgi:pimeloyl-ACP methyl ester carboxylesterase